MIEVQYATSNASLPSNNRLRPGVSKRPWRRAVMLSATVGAALFAASAAAQQGYPNRPIRMIIPFATGSATDTSARFYAMELSKQIGQ